MKKSQLPYNYFYFDLIASVLIWISFVVFRKYVNNYSILQDISILFPRHDYLISLLLFPFCCSFINYLTGFYTDTLKHTKLILLVSTFISAILVTVSVFFGTMLRDVIVSFEYFYSSMLALFLLFFFISFFSRLIVFSRVRKKFRTNNWSINTLVIGTNQQSIKIADEIKKSTNNSFVGFVSTNKRVEEFSGKLLGNLSQIGTLIKKHDIKEVVISLDDKTTEQQLFSIVNILYNYNVEIQFTPRLYEILTGSVKITNIGAIPLVNITKVPMPNWQICVKRFIDVTVSAIALIVLMPYLVFVCIRIKLDSKGPVFYKQERIGRYSKPYNILKFRTMKIDSELGIPMLSNAFDERVTKFGRTLRKYRIDEIPQFINILKGEMSLVGPRPERKYYIDNIVKEAPYYCLLYKIRPGLTSWGPIKVGYANSIEKMIERLNYDIIYLENMSLLNDFKIILFTLEIIFKGKGV